jgi:Holliday junction resolvasome RuvABC DNA-binding subunit
LGKEHLQRKRELAQRERAKDKAAQARAKARAQARAESGTKAARAKATRTAKHVHHDDIIAALRGLGFHPAEARRGAQLAAAQPEASLEACVRSALTVLTRSVVVRGERRAKCSA